MSGLDEKGLEAVARVICENNGIQPDGQQGGLGPDWRDPSWVGFVGIAEQAIRAYLAAAAPLAPDGLEPVAWLDDGSLRAGSATTAFRVVTSAQKADMPEAVRLSFNTPLYSAATISAQEAEIERLRAQLASIRDETLEEAAKVADYGVRRANRDWHDRKKAEGARLMAEELATIFRALQTKEQTNG